MNPIRRLIAFFNNIRIVSFQDYSVYSTVQCKPIVERNLEACNINFSIIDKVYIAYKSARRYHTFYKDQFICCVVIFNPKLRLTICINVLF